MKMQTITYAAFLLAASSTVAQMTAQLENGDDVLGNLFTYTSLEGGSGAFGASDPDTVNGGILLNNTISSSDVTGGFTVNLTPHLSFDTATSTAGTASVFNTVSTGWGVATGNWNGSETILLTFNTAALTLTVGESLVFSITTDAAGIDTESYTIYGLGTIGTAVTSTTVISNSTAGNPSGNITVTSFGEVATDYSFALDAGTAQKISSFSINVVPESSTYALLGGLMALSFVLGRRRK